MRGEETTLVGSEPANYRRAERSAVERSHETSPQGRSKGNGVSKHNPYPETSPLSSTLIPTGAEGSQRLLHFGRSKGGAFDFSLNRN